MIRILLCVAMLIAVLTACRGPAAEPAQSAARPVPELVPTPDRPIVLVYRGRMGFYDLVFGGKDGTGRNRLIADENTLAVVYAQRTDLAAVLSKTPDGLSALLNFYDVDGKVVKSFRIASDFLHQGGSCRMWAGRRMEAVVVSSPPLTPVAEKVTSGIPARSVASSAPPTLVAEAFNPGRPPPAAKTCWAKPDGSVLALAGFTGFNGLAFAASQGFATIRIQGNGAWRLSRYAGQGTVVWEKSLPQSSTFYLEPRADADISLRTGAYNIDFDADGIYKTQRIGYDADEFRNSNPGFAERAGQFYEKEYLPKAVQQLARAVSLSKDEQAAAEDFLKRFVYEYLDAYVRLGPYEGIGGEMPKLIARLDDQFRGLLDGKRFALYQGWRDSSRGDNALAFLFKAGGPPPRPEDEIKSLNEEPISPGPGDGSGK